MIAGLSAGNPRHRAAAATLVRKPTRAAAMGGLFRVAMRGVIAGGNVVWVGCAIVQHGAPGRSPPSDRWASLRSRRGPVLVLVDGHSLGWSTTRAGPRECCGLTEAAHLASIAAEKECPAQWLAAGAGVAGCGCFHGRV